jgi:hypothetical protein
MSLIIPVAAGRITDGRMDYLALSLKTSRNRGR